VIGVGGTSLTLTSRGAVAHETGWANGGGGVSKFFDRPSWQKAKGAPKSKKRLVPDVSLVADPETGAFLILAGKATQIGGTSWSAPVWAAFCALCNEARQKAKKDPLPFLNPALYKLAGTSAFRDINAGSNGLYSAHTGFDLVTGLGVPSVKNLRQALLKV
jgi:kumamolisin